MMRDDQYDLFIGLAFIVGLVIGAFLLAVFKGLFA